MKLIWSCSYRTNSYTLITSHTSLIKLQSTFQLKRRKETIKSSCWKDYLNIVFECLEALNKTSLKSLIFGNSRSYWDLSRWIDWRAISNVLLTSAIRCFWFKQHEKSYLDVSIWKSDKWRRNYMKAFNCFMAWCFTRKSICLDLTWKLDGGRSWGGMLWAWLNDIIFVWGKWKNQSRIKHFKGLMKSKAIFLRRSRFDVWRAFFYALGNSTISFDYYISKES